MCTEIRGNSPVKVTVKVTANYALCAQRGLGVSDRLHPRPRGRRPRPLTLDGRTNTPTTDTETARSPRRRNVKASSSGAQVLS